MTIDDHALTRTYRGRGRASMISDQGLNARDRLAKDIKDVRSVFGTKYNRGARETISYAEARPEYKKPAALTREEASFPNLLPERAVQLRRMSDAEYPVDEEAYWRNCDESLGGNSFVRVGGCLLWLQTPVEVRCTCKRAMHFIMGLGP